MASCSAIVVVAANDTVLEKLEPERRAAVVLALVGLALLGVLLVVVTAFAGRWARHKRPPRSSRMQVEAQPKARPAKTHGPHGDARRDETIVNHPGDDDTKA